MQSTRALALVLLASLGAGCVLGVVQDKPDARVEGVADGYTPMSDSLVVYVEPRPDVVRQTVFERDEWYLAGLEEALDARMDVVFEGTAEGVTWRLTVHHAPVPGELDAYRWANRSEPAAERAQMDARWDARVRELGGAGVTIDLPASAHSGSPSDA